MKITLLARYCLREVLSPLLAWLGLLWVMLFVMSFLRGTEVLLGSTITALDFARFIAWLSPQFFIQAAPIAFLLAVLLGLGRLAEDGELRAIAALGVAPRVLLAGPLLLAAALSAVMGVLAFTAQPWGLKAVRLAATELIKRNLAGDVRPGVFHEEVADFTLYAEQVEGRRWSKVVVFDGRDPAAPLLVLAQAGEVKPGGAEDETLELALRHGEVHRASAASDECAVATFDRAALGLQVGNNIFLKNRFRSPRDEQSPTELLEAGHEAEAHGESSRPFDVAFHWRLGQVAMPLAFACVGVPLALGRRGGRARSFLLTLAAYVGYYLVARSCVSMGERGVVPALLAGQLPNLLFVAAGLAGLAVLTRRAA